MYSSGRLDDAIAKYTQGMALDPTNALLPANRAMAYIKIKKLVHLCIFLLPNLVNTNAVAINKSLTVSQLLKMKKMYTV